MATGADSGTPQDRLRRVRAALAEVSQEHVLRFAEALDPQQLDGLLGQIEGLDLPRVARSIEAVLNEQASAPGQPEPPDVIELPACAESEARDREARAAGEQALADGKVGAFLVAGGQGTRLGFDGPKGRFPVGPLTRRSLFAYHAQRVLASCRRYGSTLPYYVMTSPANHADTVAAFQEAQWFGLAPEQVMFLTQGTLPAIDHDGRMLLAQKHQLALSPDGHGGCLAALDASGALDDMAARGVEQLFYFQVDNPLAPVFDPLFIGHHLLARAQMSSKVIDKTDPGEKVGVVSRRDGRHLVLEYSDLPDALANARDPDGRLRYRAGSIAIHMFELEFVRRLLASGTGMPVHRAHKRVPYVDQQGQLVQPGEPNAIKMELFVFDALLAAERVVTQVVRREDEFAPVKNADGNDSPASAHAALVSQAKRWMSAAGREAPEGDAEVGPLYALDCEDFAANLTLADYGPVFDRA